MAQGARPSAVCLELTCTVAACPTTHDPMNRLRGPLDVEALPPLAATRRREEDAKGERLGTSRVSSRLKEPCGTGCNEV